MILKGSQRGGAKQLALHLMKTEENEHVEVHQVRGFMADDVLGALREAEAISKGTKCNQFLFSVSLNPPQNERVLVETFEMALNAIEERTGLSNQPRVVVFHEKEGRRHCHAVWSRIDPETMTARPLPFFKNKLQDISREQYLENGWRMPAGLVDKRNRDPRNFTLAEWQQAKRAGRNAGDLKQLIQEAWSVSDTRETFAHALKERGFYLAKGDRRGHIALSFEGEPFSVARMLGQKAKDVKARLGSPDELLTLEDARKEIAADYLPKMQDHLRGIRQTAKERIQKVEAERAKLHAAHKAEREKLDRGQKQRREQEQRERAERNRKGLLALWDRLSGKHKAIEKQNQIEALWALERDRRQRDAIIAAQLNERRTLQARIKEERAKRESALLQLYNDFANYREMKRGHAPTKPVRRETVSSHQETKLDRSHKRFKDQFTDNARDGLAKLRRANTSRANLDALKSGASDKRRSDLNRLKRGERTRPDDPELER
jgi:hypothetical protein